MKQPPDPEQLAAFRKSLGIHAPDRSFQAPALYDAILRILPAANFINITAESFSPGERIASVPTRADWDNLIVALMDYDNEPDTYDWQDPQQNPYLMNSAEIQEALEKRTAGF